MAAVRDLLLGLVALQNGLIDQAQLVAAFQSWMRDKGRPLADHLLQLGYLDAEARAGVEAIVALHVKRHGGDAEQSLAALEIGSSTRQRLAVLGDSDLEATLAPLTAGSTPGEGSSDRTAAYRVGTATSSGQRFRVLRPHAKGGLGAVFVALDGELNREVALKEILGQHADDAASRQRFVLEAEITGGLEHPGIVPVYGLGSYADGRPYYAMRFVRGDSLRDAIAAYHAAPRTKDAVAFRQLLRRFLDVCNAIEYAHARGVLHRDIKPGNIIVGKYGETLVIDWGLAKTLGKSDPAGGERTLTPSAAGGSAETLPGSTLGTPGYMSPEQARGDLDALGPRSDVYSLGATLYCLLTGQAPFDGSALEVLRAVEAGRFPAPRAVDGGLDPALEAICLKAMAMQPGDRYATARALADDIERWLADERVAAYPEPRTRTLVRWLTRHRTGVTAAAAALLVGFVGLGSVAAVQTRARHQLARKNTELEQANTALDQQRRRAEQRETEAIDAVRKFRDAVADEPLLRDTPELEKLRRRLLQEPLVYFRALREQLQKDRDTRPESLARLASASSELGDLTAEIGEKHDALTAYRESLAIRQQLADDHPKATEYHHDLAASHDSLGKMLRDTGQLAEARAAHNRALAILQKLADDHPTVPKYQSDLAASHGNLGNLLMITGERAAARAAFEAARAILQKLVGKYPTVSLYRHGLATCHNNLGLALSDIGDQAGARAAYEQARSIQRQLANDHPTVTEYQRALAGSHYNLGILLSDTGELTEARTAYEAALAVRKKLADDHPTVTAYQRDLATSHGNLGNLLSLTGERAAARAAYEAARGILQKLADDHRTVTAYQRDLATCHVSLGTLLQATGQPIAARVAYEAAQAIRQKLATDHPAVAEYQSDLADCQHNLGILLHSTGQRAAARGAYDSVLAIRRKLCADHPAVTAYQRDLAASHLILGILSSETGQLAVAEAEYEAARAILQRLADDHPTVPEYQRDLARSYLNLGKLLKTTGQPPAARAAYDSALAILRELVDDHPTVLEYRQDLAESHDALGVLLGQFGQPAEARAAYDSALAIRRKLADDHPESPGNASALGGTLHNRALLALDARQFAEARDQLREAITWQRKAVAVDPRHRTYRQFLTNHLTCLIAAARGLGRDEDAAEAQRELDELQATDPQFEALDARLQAVSNGAAPQDNAERLVLAQRAYDIGRFTAATRLWAEALGTDPELAGSRQNQHAYNAACAAALAASGQGQDTPPPDDAAKAKLRAQALEWLTAEIALWAKLLETAKPEQRAAIVGTLEHWQQDTDLVGIRDPAALQKIPEEEQSAWRALWDKVQAVLEKARETRSGESAATFGLLRRVSMRAT